MPDGPYYFRVSIGTRDGLIAFGETDVDASDLPLMTLTDLSERILMPCEAIAVRDAELRLKETP